MENKKIKYPKIKGVKLYCSKCKKNFTAKSKVKHHETNCDGELKYAIHIHIPKSKSPIKKVLDVEKEEDAQLEYLKLKKELFEVGYKTNKKSQKLRLTENSNLIKSILIFLDFKSGKGYYNYINSYLKIETVKDYKVTIRYLNEAIKINNKSQLYTVSDVNGDLVKGFEKVLIKRKVLAQRTRKSHFGFINEFFNWLAKEFKIDITNPFSHAKHPIGDIVQKELITSSKFNSIIDIMNKNKEVKWKRGNELKSVYRDYLEDSFKLMLYLGCRVNELVHIKWKDIDFEEKIIKVVDWKLTNRNNFEISNPRFIHYELERFLLKIKTNENPEEYLIAPNLKSNRRTIERNIGNGFNFYSKLAGYDYKFKELRKYYSTTMVKLFGTKSIYFTGHKDHKVTNQHYNNYKSIILDVVKEKSDFKLLAV